MNLSYARLTLHLVVAAFATFATAAYAQSQRYVDPPSRVARLAHAEGRVSFSPAGTDEWRRAQRNRPHWRGDRLWTDRRSRAELQLGGAALRLDERTGVEILELDDRYAQFELSEGTVNLSVRHLDRGDAYEIATPMLALVVDRRATLRVEVDPRSGDTEIVMWHGSAIAYGQRGQFALRDGDAVRFYDPSLRDYDFFDPRPDGFDAYADARDARLERSGSLRYVPAGLIGYAELDDYGSWRTTADYGPVWFPSRVGSGWRPYRDGHWIYQEPWGWTWIDDSEWGFATSHYGRWAQIDRRWGWIPSPRRERPVYAPALVAFLGGFDSGSRQPIGWFPLGPREVYMPTYRTSRDYFSRVNFGNTVFQDRRYVTDAYSAYERGRIAPNQTYRYNRGEYVTAVPRDVFTGARAVSQAAVPYTGDSGAMAQLDRIRALQPTRQSRYGAAAPAAAAPTGEVFEREVYARHVPPPAPVVQAAAGEPRSRDRDAGDRENVRMIRGEGLPVIPRDAPRTEGTGEARDRGAERAAAREAPPAAGEPGRQRDVDSRDRDARASDEAVREREALREATRAQREAEQRQQEEQERQREAEQAQRQQQRAAAEAQRAAEEAQREQQREAERQAQRDAEAARREAARGRDRSQEAEAAVVNERARRELERVRQEEAQDAQRQQREAEQAQREAERAQRQQAQEAERAQREAQQAQQAQQRELEQQAREQQQAQREAERMQREQAQAVQAEQQRVAREQEAAQREAERQAREQQQAQAQAQREAERAAQEQQRAQEQAQREAERAAQEQQRAQEQAQEQAQREAERAAQEQQRAQAQAQREAEQAAQQQAQSPEEAEREAERAAREAEREERRRRKDGGDETP